MNCWVIFCTDEKGGIYNRFQFPQNQESRARFWLNWLTRNEPETAPQLHFCKLTLQVNHG